MTCGRVSPMSTQSTFEDLAVDFEGTTASGAERFYRRTLDKLLESGLVHTVRLADWDTTTSNIFAKTAIRFVQGLPEARLLKSVTVPFWKGGA